MKTFKENFGDEYYHSMPTLADAIKEILTFFSCENIYGVAGDYAAPLILALDNAFEILPSSNEMHAGFSACAAAEITGFGCCLTTYMVGSLPCTSAAALALSERLPVVFISGAPGENEVNESALHHTLVRSDSWRIGYENALDAFRNLGVKAERLQGDRNPYQPNIAGEQFFQLIRHAVVNREPVLIEIPRDLVDIKTQLLTLPEHFSELLPGPSLFSGVDMIAAHIVEKLNKSRNPIIYVGEKTRINRFLKNIIRQFSHKFNIPIVSNIYSKGIFGDDEVLFLGTYNGVFSKKSVRIYVEKVTDFILEVGTSTISQDVSNALNTGSNVIKDFYNKVAIIGTSKMEMDEVSLFEKLINLNIEVRPGYEDYSVNNNERVLVNDEDLISYYNLYAILKREENKTNSSFIYLPEVGSAYFCSFSIEIRKSELGRSWLTNPWYGAMGTSIPYARAVCHQLKNKDLSDIPIVVIGDGGFHFQCNELIHFSREKLPVLIVYLNNQVSQLGKCCDSNIYQCSAPDFDVIKLVESYGGVGERVKTVKEFAISIRNYLQNPNQIKIIDVMLDMNPEKQNKEIELFNLYIQAQAKIPEAVSAWEKVLRGDISI